MKIKTMKKSIFILVAVLLAAYGNSQDTITTDNIVPLDAEGNITWQDVVRVPDQEQLDLYYKGIEWLNTYFPNAARVTRRRSPESGIIEGAHSIRLFDVHDEVRVPSGAVNYTFKLEFREGRFRYTITDFNVRAASRFPMERWLDDTGPFYNPANKAYLEQVRYEIEKMIESMTQYITRPPAPEEEDW